MKLAVWITSYVFILVIMGILYLISRREKLAMEGELRNFEEVDGMDHSFLEASRFD